VNYSERCIDIVLLYTNSITVEKNHKVPVYWMCNPKRVLVMGRIHSSTERSSPTFKFLLL
jgi:hypothetical protein